MGVAVLEGRERVRRSRNVVRLEAKGTRANREERGDLLHGLIGFDTLAEARRGVLYTAQVRYARVVRERERERERVCVCVWTGPRGDV